MVEGEVEREERMNDTEREREKVRERQTDREILYILSLSRCPQRSGMEWTTPSRSEFYLDL